MRKHKHIDGIIVDPNRRRIDTSFDKKHPNQSANVVGRDIERVEEIHSGRLNADIKDYSQAGSAIGLAQRQDSPSIKVDNQNSKTMSRFNIFKRKTRKKPFKKPINRRARIKKIGIISSVFVVAFIGLFALKGWTTLSNIIDRAGSGSPLLGGSKLQGEGDGRVNIMLLGIDDEGTSGGALADTILIVSIDPIASEAVLLSIPRDLYVPIPTYEFSNNQIFIGHSAKINAAHSLGENLKKDGGVELISKTLENVLGTPIHYYVKAGFTGFEKAVNAVGGVDLMLSERVYKDYSFEYGRILDIGPGKVHLNGRQALLLGRNRDYIEGDVVRNDYQRELLIALKNKALSLETIANPKKLLDILNTLSGHIRTNLQPSEILRLREIGEKIPPSNILSYGLSGREGNYLVSSTHPTYGFVWQPRGGNYDEIKTFVASIFVDGFIKGEAATIDILNGTNEIGLATLKYNELKDRGYYLGSVGDFSGDVLEKTLLIDLKNQSPFTKRYLEQRFKLKAVSAELLPSGITTTADFVIILGNDAKTKTTES